MTKRISIRGKNNKLLKNNKEINKTNDLNQIEKSEIKQNKQANN